MLGKLIIFSIIFIFGIQFVITDLGLGKFIKKIKKSYSNKKLVAEQRKLVQETLILIDKMIQYEKLKAINSGISITDIPRPDYSLYEKLKEIDSDSTIATEYFFGGNGKFVAAYTSNTLSTGNKIRLDNPVFLYADATIQTYSSSVYSGIYYVWSDKIMNNRIRITNRLENVGVDGMVTGWIDVKDIQKVIKRE